MKVKPTIVFDTLSRMREYFQSDLSFDRSTKAEPFRSELYNFEQMETHAKVVAKSHKVLKDKVFDRLLKRLGENEKALIEVRNLLVESVQSGKTITPGAEWLLDNFYLIEEQVVIARKHLPKGYSEGLPYVKSGNSTDIPRVYDIAVEIISHSDGRVDARSLIGFIAAYQTEKILTLGELWAIPIMLRIAVIENLRRVSEEIALDLIDNNLADYWAEQMLETVKEEPANLVLRIADMARSKPILESSFVAGFTRKLQGKGSALALPLNWMEQQLSQKGIASNDLIWLENQSQAIDQVSVRNSIGTLRFIGSSDWRDFVEKLSSVEQILRKDTTGIYPLMDFATRDRYRHVVEAIAKASSLSETDVANKVMKLVGIPTLSNEKFKRNEHVGYFLVDKGRRETEEAAKMRYTFAQRLTRFMEGRPVFIYLFSIFILTGIGAAFMFSLAYQYGTFRWPILALVAILSVAGAAELAISFTNWLATIWVRPTPLARLDFSKGIPSEYRTLVAIPTMLSTKNEIEELVEALEVRFLANRESNLHYALLTDYTDADSEFMPEDDSLLEFVSHRINELNEKYSKSEKYDVFFLFQRPRKWNPKEGKWMGYERKRGKLASLNALLRRNQTNDFSTIVGGYEVLTNVKYVITLDSDTQLPREAAWKFIATMAHPLNHAVFDPKKKRVTDGYGILQPRIAFDFPKGATSLYLRMQGDVTGVDPYTRASSDVYQDLFSEGSFIGKGIYDVDIFEKAVGNVFQENRILSHDLLEGCYARSGLLSDVLLYEHSPSKYETDVKRHHRWIRGDWQIGAWAMPYVSDIHGRLKRNHLSILSRWKIVDNMRRSLLPLSLLLILLLGWSLLPYPWFWTLAVTTIVLLPVMAAAALQLIRRPEDRDLNAHVSDVISSVKEVLFRFMFGMAVLPYEAYRYTDAIIRANWRLLISGKRLLEWTTSAEESRNTKNNIWSNYKAMWIGPLLATVCFILFLYTNYPAFYVASPILILWFIGPAIAWRLNVPEKEEVSELSEDQTVFLHKTARKTWSFFEQFLNADENWLPPDNFQEHPAPVIAHRTSPTNMGLGLLANLTAYDFGYIPIGELIFRCRKTLQTMLKMDRYEGHFYNWYNTLSLSPLQPRYISTVDSGNLVGHLLTLRQGFLTLSEQPVFNPQSFEGIKTTAEILQDLLKDQKNETLEQILALVNTAIEDKNLSLSIIKIHLDELRLISSKLPLWEKEDESDFSKWKSRLQNQLESIRNDLLKQIPWLELLPVPDQFIKLVLLNYNNSLSFIHDTKDEYLNYIDHYREEENTAEEKEWLTNMQLSLENSSISSQEKINELKQLAEQCEQLSTVNYSFLFDKSTSLLRIGFNVDEQRKDDSYYDMLASEARLGVFVAIAQGKLPQESWFSLGRILTNSKAGPILLSWSGSMFEYLMPQIIMPSYENTLLTQTNIATVKRQIEYAKKQGVPWGISESGYNSVDANLNYQYQAFGVPGLGLKRGLEDDLVIAPYASLLALMIAPVKACENLKLLSNESFEGEYGFYEAIDYTKSRLPRNRNHVVINSYMAHHQGMGLLSLAYVLLNKPMQKRFVSERRFQATLLLLQERVPKTSVFYAHTSNIKETHTIGSEVQVRSISTPNTQMPELQLLSNGNYQVMVSNSGGGYSRWKNLSITRWREDLTKDDYGMFCYIKDVDSGNLWSNTYHPTMHPATSYETIFSKGHVEFYREDYGIQTKTEIVVSPEDDAEMRRIRITNLTQSVRVLELTSYTEIVMASQASDESHPAFSNLFVQTEILPEYNAIFTTRRPRSEDEFPPHLFHLMDVYGGLVEEVSYETDRMQFIGRGRTLAHPQAMETKKLLGNQGSVLDPIMAIRYRITLEPSQTATIHLIMGISETKESSKALMHKYIDRSLRKRAFELAWTHSQVLLRQINASQADGQVYGKLAASVIYPNPKLRADSAMITSNFRGQSELWSHSVSGDLPIVLLQIFDPESIGLVSQMIKAHSYWQLKGLAVDLVIWNEEHGSYRHVLQDQILGMVTEGIGLTHHVPGSIYVKSADQLSAEDRILFESVAKIIIKDTEGTLLEQISSHYKEAGLPPLLKLKSIITPSINKERLALPEDLLFFNGTGGFTADGKEYKILIDKNITTPAPWSNVIANPILGTVVSESGSAYTWAVNAHEYRITPWSNDPVTDTGGEAFYIRDEETGEFWSPAPFPAKGKTPYIATHGFGYTKYEYMEAGISSEMKVFVDKEAPIKFVVLKIKNQSGRSRKFSATGYLEIILGSVRSKTNMHILSEHDAQSGALLFRNRYNSAFAERVAFFKVNGGHNFSFTVDRAEFIGRNRNLVNPQALSRKRLSGRIGAGMDTCAALQVKFDLLEGAEKEIVFQIGNEANTQSAMDLIHKFTDQNSVLQSLQQVKEYWKETLEAVQVTTPDHSLNVLANGWLTYQTIASRLFARSGFYQSGGAFGFRDQLQDVLSLLHTKPQLAREQILLNASRQFLEGDVQHWWHPPEGRGVRTNYSDDFLWLPFAVSRYINATGDRAILKENLSFLESRLLHEGEDSLYELPLISNKSADLYEHCVRAIKNGLHFGKHGLPLMGSGDWNDGMDQVGNKGEGESVWLAFFLYDVLKGFEDVATAYGDASFSDICRTKAAILQSNIEASAWDGEWYKRAWFDDGTPLGSKENEECSIDAISQSWAVLSSAAPIERRNKAMESLDKYLVKRDMKIIQLLDPPFDKSDLNPGYIKGYVPGVRENGGQYSHAAIWTLMAFAKLADREKVYELFSMVQPVNHALNAEDVQVYKVEPYVMAADVYANVTHRGRGGWTWYTGSSGWMYQFIIGSLIGMELQVDQLKFTPCFPLDWPEISIKYQYKTATYNIKVYQVETKEESWWKMGLSEGKGDTIPLRDDGMEHEVEIHISI